MRNILAISLCLLAACATDDDTTPPPDELEAPTQTPWEDLTPEEIDQLPELEQDTPWDVPDGDLPPFEQRALCARYPVLCEIARYEHAIQQQP